MMLRSTILYYTYDDQAEMMPTSVRLDPETGALLDQLAQTRRRTKSDILREALRRLAQDEQVKEVDDGPYALVADLIGIVQGVPAHLSV
jgi:predicted DNA-binding protein